MDRLESVVEFGVSLSPGENEYTQSIDLWYTENKEQVKYNYHFYDFNFTSN